MILICPDVHLICTNDLLSLTFCLNYLLICELVLPMFVLPVVISACACYVRNKRLRTYLLT